MSKKERQKKKKEKKEKRPFSLIEKIYIILNVIFVIGLCSFYGYRMVIYHEREKQERKAAVSIFNEAIIANNDLVKTGTGLHRDKDGYYFKGDPDNNYVKFANRLYRIIRVNKDGSVKVISNELVGSFMNGTNEYHNGNVRKFLEKTDNKNSGIYYDTIPGIDKYLVKTTYTIDVIKDNKITNGTTDYSDYITTLQVNDYAKAGGMDSYLNISKYFYTTSINDQNKIITIDNSGSINPVDGATSTGVRAVFTFKKNLNYSGGVGTEEDPYVITQDIEKNYVDNYVRLGNNLWKVYYDKNDILKMALYGYIKDGSSFVKKPFTTYEKEFLINRYDNIGYYLNYSYYNNLDYSKYIISNNYYIGSVGIDNKHSFNSYFEDKIKVKVGMLGLFDYNNLYVLDDYYLINTTTNTTTKGIVDVYVYHNNGYVEETYSTTEKKIVPVISIKKSSIKTGEGSLDQPYGVG